MTYRHRRNTLQENGFSVTEVLGVFQDRAEQLERHELLGTCAGHYLTIEWEKSRGLKFESTEPNDDVLRSYAALFRRFIMPNEAIQLYKVYKICQQVISSSELKQRLAKSREAWHRSFESTGMALIYNGNRLTPEQLADLWINGYLLHDEPSKYRALQQLMPHERMLTKQNFISFLLAATRQVLYVAFIIKVAIKENALHTRG